MTEPETSSAPDTSSAPEAPLEADAADVVDAAGDDAAEGGDDAGAQGGEGRRERRPRRDRDRDHRGRRIDNAPPRFNVDELVELTGYPLWQAVHTGTIVEVTPAAVVVEIKAPGHEPQKALVKPEELADLTLGSAVRVRLGNPPPPGEVLAIASAKHARDLDRYDEMQSAAQSEGVMGAVVREVKGGYSVALFTDEVFGPSDGAIRAFLPASQATLSRFGPQKGEKIVGAVGLFKIGEIDLERGNIVVSRKAALLAARDRDTKEKLAHLKEGDVVQGVVRSVVAYGAFLDVAGLDALLHRDDIAHDLRGRIENYVKVGSTIDVKVLQLKERKLKVGIKQLRPDPWAEVRAAFAEGSVVKGVVAGLADFGVFVKLPIPSNPSEHIEGLIHISEVSFAKVKHPSVKFTIGQEVDVKVLGLDTEHRRISLSTKALEKNPFETISERFPPGTVVKAKVKTLTEFGAFITLADGVDGLVHIGEISWTAHPQHPSELLTVGQEVEAVVMSVDVQKQRVSCSMKRAQENPFDNWEKKYRQGARHKLKVVRVDDKGAQLEVEGGLSCYCSWRDLLDKEGNPVERAGDAVRVGQEIEVEVRAFDRRFRKVSVSMRALVENETRAAYHEYKKKEQAQQGLNSLADKLKGVKIDG